MNKISGGKLITRLLVALGLMVLLIPGTALPVAAAAPAAPSVLTAVLNTDINGYVVVDLTWHDNSANETGFVIESATNTAFDLDYIEFQLPAGTTSFTDTTVDPYSDVTFYYRIYATNVDGDSGYSNLASVYKPSIFSPTVPTSPSNLVGTPVIPGALNLSWNDNSNNELGFILQRATNSLFTANVTAFSTDGPNITSLLDDTILPNATYYYRVYAWNGLDISRYSNTLKIVIPGALPAPSNLHATQVSSIRVGLAWNDNSVDELGFRVERASDIDFNFDVVVIGNTGANVTTINDNTVSPVTTYYYRVQAFNSFYSSPYSNIISVTTPPTPTITLTSPNGGETWLVGSVHAITWTTTNFIGSVSIQLSRDGGVTWSAIIPGTANDGSENWTVTSPATTSAWVKVFSIDNSAVYDTSNASFTIADPPPPPTITVTSPNGGQNWAAGSLHDITWTSANLTGNVKIELLKAGVVVSTLTSAVSAAAGSFTWMIPVNQTLGTDYKVKITSTTASSVNDSSNNNFTISAPPPLTLLSPRGGEVWSAGSTHSITWSSVNLTGYLRIELLKGSTVVRTLTSTARVSAGTYNWTILASQTPGSDYRIRITSRTTTSISKASGYFTIVGPPPPSVTLLSPDGGEVWAAGSTHSIRWSSVNLTGYLRIELLKGNTVVRTLTSYGRVTTGSYNWTISASQTPGTDYRIRITSRTNSSVTNTGGYFRITGP